MQRRARCGDHSRGVLTGIHPLISVCGRFVAGELTAMPEQEELVVSDKLLLDADGRIDEDVPCASCSYNLRGLGPEGNCPECAGPVLRSAHSGLLRFSNPKWVNQLASGIRWLDVGVICGLLAMIFGPFAAWLLSAIMGEDVATALVVALLATGVAVGLGGVWKVTVPEPDRRRTEVALSIRRVARTAPTLAITLGLFGTATNLWELNLTGRVAWAAPVAAWVLVQVGWLAWLVYCRRLAWRIPHKKLARDACTALWVVVAANGSLGMFCVLEGLNVEMPELAATVLGAAAVVGYLLAFLMTIVLVGRHRKPISQAARQAAQADARKPSAQTCDGAPIAQSSGEQ